MRIPEFILAENVNIRGTELFTTIRTIKFGLKISTHQFFDMLELYCAETDTFFMPYRKLDFALHEMHEVSGLFIGKSPYEEYIPEAPSDYSDVLGVVPLLYLHPYQ